MTHFKKTQTNQTQCNSVLFETTMKSSNESSTFHQEVTSDTTQEANPTSTSTPLAPCFTRDSPPPFCRSIIRYHHPQSGGSSPCTSYAICSSILQAHIMRVGSWCICRQCVEEDSDQGVSNVPVIDIERTGKWHISKTDESNHWRKSPGYTILWLQGNQDHYRRNTMNSVVTEDDHFYIIPLDLTTFLDHLRPLQEHVPLRKWCACNKSSEEALTRADVAVACYTLSMCSTMHVMS